MKPHALLVEDDEASLDALEKLVQSHGFATTAVQTLDQARAELDEAAPDLVVLDLDLPDGRGTDLIEQLQTGLDAEIVVVTGHGTIDSAVGAMHAGVTDYLTKPLDPERFGRVLSGVKRTLALREEVVELRANLRRLGRFDLLVGASAPMQRVYDFVSRVARTSSTVLVTGETGSGKDVIAQTIHRLSRRASGPFVAVNCGAIQASLIESELFGHEPGAFTGATRTRKGVFEQAKGGTLFLDEIVEMPADLQVKLLRVLETRTIQRVGGERSIEVDVRLVAATNRDPQQAVREETLREDLFYRLQVFPIEVPPLRERDRDIELLASFFLDELNEDAEEEKQLEPEALDALRAYDWPGNVRELRNMIERAFILAEDRITPDHFHFEPTTRAQGSGADVSIDVGTSIAEAEKQLIVETLERLDGNKKKAAEVLGISLKTLYNRLNSYGLGRSGQSSASS